MIFIFSKLSTMWLFLSLNQGITLEIKMFILKALREKDGIPDLRRAARFRYSSVTLPEVGFSIHIVVDHTEYKYSTDVIYVQQAR